MRDIESQRVLDNSAEYDTFRNDAENLRVFDDSFIGKLKRNKLYLIVGVVALLVIVGVTLMFVLVDNTSVDDLLVYSITAKTGAVASDNANCSRIGVDVMELGGNAVDAAVSVALCLGVLQPFASGIGGGGFLMVHMNGKAITNDTNEVFNFREMAPAAATPYMYYENPENSKSGPLAAGVPGEIKGLFAAHSSYGKLPWRTVVEPAMLLARNGFTVFPLLADRIMGYNTTILRHASLASVYAPNGRLLQEGDFMRLPTLANTLEAIANEGSDALYRGSVGDALVADIQAAGGIITKQDLANFHVERAVPLSVKYHDRTVFMAPPPSSGAMIGFMLNILEEYSLDHISPSLRTHYIIESLKHAFAHRYLMGDPSFTANMTAFISEMLSKPYAAEIRTKINPERTFDVPYYLIDGLIDETKGHGTSHFSVVDKDRNTVSMTTTVNLGWGSKFISASTGILLNDEMDDFSTTNSSNAFGIPPSKANSVYPGKRPLSSMTPTIVLSPDTNSDNIDEQQLLLSVGGSGGPNIISSVIETLVDILSLGNTPFGSMRKPRFHSQLIPPVVNTERGFSLEIIDQLIARGHNLTTASQLADGQIGGVVQAIRNDVFTGELQAVSDWRKMGRPAGYTQRNN